MMKQQILFAETQDTRFALSLALCMWLPPRLGLALALFSDPGVTENTTINSYLGRGRENFPYCSWDAHYYLHSCSPSCIPGESSSRQESHPLLPEFPFPICACGRHLGEVYTEKHTNEERTNTEFNEGHSSKIKSTNIQVLKFQCGCQKWLALIG